MKVGLRAWVAGALLACKAMIDASNRSDHQQAMFRALSLSFAQLSDRAFLTVLLKSLAVTLLIFAVGGIGLYFLLGWLIGLTGWTGGGSVAAAGALAIMLAGGWLWWRAVAMAVIGFFADDIVDAVERKHYPDHHARAMKPSFREETRVAMGSIGRALGWNLAALPLYIALLITGIGTVAAVFLVNAILLSRDLADLVAIRHVPEPQREEWRRRTRPRRLQLGLVSAGLFVVPVANLLAPILSAAMAAHMLHRGEEPHA